MCFGPSATRLEQFIAAGLSCNTRRSGSTQNTTLFVCRVMWVLLFYFVVFFFLFCCCCCCFRCCSIIREGKGARNLHLIEHAHIRLCRANKRSYVLSETISSRSKTKRYIVIVNAKYGVSRKARRTKTTSRSRTRQSATGLFQNCSKPASLG